MSTDPVQVERRVAYRFGCHVAIAIRDLDAGTELAGCTENVSMRGAYFYTESPLSEGTVIEVTLTLPSEITLSEEMRVRCRARVLRTTPADAKKKPGTAVHFESFEYLTPSANVTSSTAFERLSPLHEHVTP
jgi:PilZ domain